MTTPVTRWPVAVLGATGAVGQAFIRLLEGHPWFDLVEVAEDEVEVGAPVLRDGEGGLGVGHGEAHVKPCDHGVVVGSEITVGDGVQVREAVLAEHVGEGVRAEAGPCGP